MHDVTIYGSVLPTREGRTDLDQKLAVQHAGPIATRSNASGRDWRGELERAIEDLDLILFVDNGHMPAVKLRHQKPNSPPSDADRPPRKGPSSPGGRADHPDAATPDDMYRLRHSGGDRSSPPLPRRSPTHPEGSRIDHRRNRASTRLLFA